MCNPAVQYSSAWRREKSTWIVENIFTSESLMKTEDGSEHACFIIIRRHRRGLHVFCQSWPPICPRLAMLTSKFSTMAAFSGLAIRMVFTAMQKRCSFHTYNNNRLRYLNYTSSSGRLIEHLRKNAILHISFLLSAIFFLFLSILKFWQIKTFCNWNIWFQVMHYYYLNTWGSPDCCCCCCLIWAIRWALIAANSSSAI